jgi:hypothetical protein
VVGPKVKTRLDDRGMLMPEILKEEKESAVWEAYADDFEEVDAFAVRFIRMLNLVHAVRGWVGGLYDLANAAVYPLVSLFRRTPK